MALRKALWPDCSMDMHSVEIREIVDYPDTTTVLVIIDDAGNVHGFAELRIRERVDGSTSPRVGYLEGWYVAPEFRGRGWGKKLIEEACTWVRSKGLTELASDAEAQNDQGIAAHARAGFSETFRVVQFIRRV